MAKRRFPTLAVIILILAILWLLTDFNIIKINIPWIPIILIIVATGMIINRYNF